MNVEDQIQAGIVDFIRRVASPCEPWAVPNGGLRSAREASRFKWTGVVAGVPNLTVALPGGRVGFIEVKGPKGVLSPEQRIFHARLVALGHRPVIARSIEDARAALAGWGVHTREAIP